MLEYEKFVQKMIALNLHEILPYVAETVQYNFYLYSAIHWMEVSLTIEALHQGLISLVSLLPLPSNSPSRVSPPKMPGLSLSKCFKTFFPFESRYSLCLPSN